MTLDRTSLETALLHTGMAPFNAETGAAPVALPAMRTSTVRFENLAALDRAQAAKARGERVVTYGRMGMDTHAALESVFIQLEQGTHAYLAPSGLAAITLTLLALLDAGDHVLMADSVYGPVRYLHQTVLKRLNIDVTYFKAGEDLSALARPNTKMIYIESPGSLLFEMLDVPALAAWAKRLGVPLVADNTWGSGYIYRPLALGADVSIVAGTKYVGGHSDLMLGAVVVKDAGIAQRINETQYAMGYSVSADDAWLALRGVRTLPVRMAQHASNALAVCEFLAGRDEVAMIYHPAWAQDPGHALWQRDCTGSNGMLALSLKLPVTAARSFVDALTLFGIGFSWGGFESLVQYVEPAGLAGHAYWTTPARPQGHGTEQTAEQPQGQDPAYPTLPLVRLHIGLESVEDVIADLTQALDQAKALAD